MLFRKLLFGLGIVFLASCVRETVVVEEHYYDSAEVTVSQLLSSYELWYVDINETTGYGETPFLQMAFTISFLNGTMYANNNLAGFGSEGDGYGIAVGTYDAYDSILDVNHVIDGFETFDIYQINSNTIELYNPANDTSYFLNGYQRSTFDYDFIFYDNIRYFLQEYEVWEKTYTSQLGLLNEFDNENYLQFLSDNFDTTFKSSQDINAVDYDAITWDYTGVYGVNDVSNNTYLKTLTLDYDFFADEYFELTVLDDATIELYHPNSDTFYEFTGRNFIQYLRTETTFTNKKRKMYTSKKANPRVPIRS